MEIKLPAYFKYTVILLGLFLLLYFMQTFKSILIPLSFAGLFALLLLPMSVRLERHMPRAVAIVLSLVLVILVLALMVYFFSIQIGSFSAELNDISAKLSILISKIQMFLQDKFGIKPTNRSEFLEKALGNISQTGTAFLGSTISLTTGALTVVTLIPIYVFCMLYYRDHLRQFVFQFIPVAKRDTIIVTIDNIQQVVQSYISGLVIVIVIVAILNSIGLFIMGIEYAIFFGAFASVLTVIPYIGIMLGAALPALYVLVNTGSVTTMLIVVAIFAFVQFLEGNFITPNIVGSKVSINPFAAIIALIVGGEVWGAAGMILSIPLIAILKVLLDQYTPLKPIAFLLGDIHREPRELKLIKKLRRQRKA
ncbi:AI-2E family transporter [Nibribacter ruber]|uniref:AI-2E family transporter n=1 Tax=Nibribacter ruber TaxID=2698458 RepID=A0A6P1NRK5_9BACT|nr:AI-2E family transporter [Nibribacter ruber]QHL86307.1 AI-2E family transporter [Nibribacter ruber]